MKLYANHVAVPVCYPASSSPAVIDLITDFTERLDELIGNVPAAGSSFSEQLLALPHAGNAIHAGLHPDLATSWFDDSMDFGLKVVTDGMDQYLQIVGANDAFLARALHMMLWRLGWRHYQPNGVYDGGQHDLRNLWVALARRSTIRTQVDRTWSGAVEVLSPAILGGTSVLTWSDGGTHSPSGLVEGRLAEELETFLQRNGWNQVEEIQTGEAWWAIAGHAGHPSIALSPWDALAYTGEYTPESAKLDTSNPDVISVAVDYVTDKHDATGLGWISVGRSDGDVEWDVWFNNASMPAPVDRQIGLADDVLDQLGPDYAHVGVVIQAYGECARAPAALPRHRDRVFVVVTDAYRPAGMTNAQVIEPYLDLDGPDPDPSPVGLYLYPYTAAWAAEMPGVGWLARPDRVVAKALEVSELQTSRTTLLTGEGMASYGHLGLHYYAFMRLVLEVGSETPTLDRYQSHKDDFLTHLFPAARAEVQRWYDLLEDSEHAPLLHEHLVSKLWRELDAAFGAAGLRSKERRRIAELGKYTHYLELRAAWDQARDEASYDALFEWVFRIRDSGLVDAKVLFAGNLLDSDMHAACGLDTIFAALNEPPVGGRGTGGLLPAWDTTLPTTGSIESLAALHATRVAEHGLAEASYAGDLVTTGLGPDLRPPFSAPTFKPKRSPRTRWWLRSGGASGTVTFEADCYRTAGDVLVEFVNESGIVDATLLVENPSPAVRHAVDLNADTLYEIRLTAYGTGDQILIDWTPYRSEQVSYEFGRDGDNIGWGQDDDFYFFVPADTAEINLYVDGASGLDILDEVGSSVLAGPLREYDYNAVPIASAPVDRVFAVVDLPINQRFFFLNLPNLFARHPDDLLVPSDA